MRKILIDITAFGFVGAVAASFGATFETWQFWALITAMVAIQVNRAT